MNHESCQSCRFSRLGQMGGQTMLQCRAQFPQVVLVPMMGGAPQAVTLWPSVEKDHWCGKFEGDPVNNREVRA